MNWRFWLLILTRVQKCLRQFCKRILLILSQRHNVGSPSLSFFYFFGNTSASAFVPPVQTFTTKTRDAISTVSYHSYFPLILNGRSIFHSAFYQKLPLYGIYTHTSTSHQVSRFQSSSSS